VTGDRPDAESLRPATPEANAALRARLEELLGEYDRARAQLGTMQRTMREARGEATSKDRSVAVTVGPRGNLVALTIEPRAYRQFSPSALATEITALVKKATDQVTQKLAGVMAPFLPEGVCYSDVLSGQASADDWDSVARQGSARLKDWWSLVGQPPDSGASEAGR
jgi:DNA-binding protein YbaB